jgi:hypothetical protein
MMATSRCCVFLWKPDTKLPGSADSNPQKLEAVFWKPDTKLPESAASNTQTVEAMCSGKLIPN